MAKATLEGEEALLTFENERPHQDLIVNISHRGDTIEMVTGKNWYRDVFRLKTALDQLSTDLVSALQLVSGINFLVLSVQGSESLTKEQETKVVSFAVHCQVLRQTVEVDLVWTGTEKQREIGPTWPAQAELLRVNFPVAVNSLQEFFRSLAEVIDS